MPQFGIPWGRIILALATLVAIAFAATFIFKGALAI